MDGLIVVCFLVLVAFLVRKFVKRLFGVGKCMIEAANNVRRTKTPTKLPAEVALILRELALLEEETGGKGFGIFDAGPLPDRLDDEALCKVAAEMARHIGMGDVGFSIEYVAFEQGTAGQIHWPDGDAMTPTIYVDYKFGREPSSVIKILAHEMAHEYRHLHGLVVSLEDGVEELLTDVTSVYLGFGRYILNGAAMVEGDVLSARTTYTTGYMKPVCFAYVYDLVCNLRGMKENELLDGLNLMARNDLRQSRWTESFVMPPKQIDQTAINKPRQQISSATGTVRSMLTSTFL